MIDNTNTNVESTVEEMRIFNKNNVRGLQLSNVPYTTDGSGMNTPQKYAKFTGYNVDGTFGMDVALTDDTTRQYYTEYGTNKYCSGDSECKGTYQSNDAFKTLVGSEVGMEKSGNSTSTTMLLCSADGTTCEDGYYTKDQLLVVTDTGDCDSLTGQEKLDCLGVQSEFSGSQDCADYCTGSSECGGYNYFSDDNLCMPVNNDKIIGLATTDAATITGGVKVDSANFIEQFDEVRNLNTDNTSALNTIIDNQTDALDNLTDLTKENELRNRKFNDLIKAKQDIANTKARMMQIETETLIYKNKTLYSIVSLIFVLLIVIIVLYKTVK
jgi:hypothetical protein